MIKTFSWRFSSSAVAVSWLKSKTHHDAVGLLVCSLLHQAGQLTEVLLVLLQESRSGVAETTIKSNWKRLFELQTGQAWTWDRTIYLSLGPGKEVRGWGELTGCADWDHWETCSRLDESGLAAIEFRDEFWACERRKKDQTNPERRDKHEAIKNNKRHSWTKWAPSAQEVKGRVYKLQLIIEVTVKPRPFCLTVFTTPELTVKTEQN